MKSGLTAVLYATSLLLASCGTHSGKQDTPLFQMMENTGIDFTNTVKDDKLENSFLFRNFYNGGGVALGDINNDGLPDVFLTSNTGPNKLYLNKGNFQFEDITDKAGIIHDDKWNTGVTFADVNGDGWLDIYVCSSGHMGTGNRKNKLYINNHNNTFTEAAKQYGLDISAYTTQVSFFDYDGDGDLDCFMIDNSPIPINQLNYANRRDEPDSTWKIPPFLKGGGDHLYRNDNGHFTEVTRQAGIHGGLISFGLGVSVGDINGDGWPDVFVSNDSYERDYLYINQKNGTFRDELEDWFQHTSFSSMGADIADINNDGYPDIFTTDMLPLNDYRLKTTGSFDHIDLYNSKIKAGFYYQYTKNCLQLNNRNGKFIDIARYSGVAATDWSWGALMFDMDNDGWNDLYVCNGVNRDVTNLDFMDFFADEIIQKMVLTGKKEEVDKVVQEIPRTPLPNQVYHNNGNLSFTNTGEQWGLAQTSWSNGAAYADLDNDGDLDLVVNNINQPAFVYKNNSRELNHNNFLAVKVKGSSPNTFAIGTRLQLYANSQVQTREVIPSRGFQSSVDYKQIFGLGKITHIDSLVVTWPNQSKTTIPAPQPNQTLSLAEPVTTRPTKPLPVSDQEHISTEQSFFTEIRSSFDKHSENEFSDFYQERIIPRMLSREVPKAATADVNGDGLMDIYIGGTPVHPGQLYLQTAQGSFVKKEIPAFEPFKSFEDVACLFFDYDHDGDMDLLIAPGGNNAIPGSRELQLRLFKNDGHGNFTLDPSALPQVGTDISVVIANDFNNDGFPDLFVGGRNYPGVYGKDPPSFLFQNDGKGHFTDITSSACPELTHLGMVTGAVWADITGDANKELVVVGEWMAPHIYTYSNGQFRQVRSNLDSHYGWYQTVAAADLNNDGKQDLIFGNIGENFLLKPDPQHPAKLWLNDFDKNGDIDKIITYTIDGKDMPVYLKHDLEEQLPSIKKGNLKHKDYATKAIQDLYPEQVLKETTVKLFTDPSSFVAYNKGNGAFDLVKMPVMSQMSCINAIQVMDVNRDGRPDLVTGGNQFGFLPQFERLDGSFGDVLMNQGNERFQFTDHRQSGINVRGEIRDIKEIDTRKYKALIFLQNDDYPVLLKFNDPSSQHPLTGKN